ncbi:hypothetical protein [Flavobacterium enshiense]|uniref:Uncharacterized protein n=1 Tax=Flavobacterium enshiense DK69 TaxID=1107311 RepID=A0A0A2N7X8_9FLAO|nr:hypothetical protein [Flavobacterium enshiense]KGO96560.1 hypothetical protein Q767_06620 [Flavobacterium enshiense DK69]
MFSKEKIGKGRKGMRVVLLLLLVSCFFSVDANAQCAMCRAALESEESGVQAGAVNDGIVYLMAIPYILVGAIGYAIYRLKYGSKRKEK